MITGKQVYVVRNDFIENLRNHVTPCMELDRKLAEAGAVVVNPVKSHMELLRLCEKNITDQLQYKPMDFGVQADELSKLYRERRLQKAQADLRDADAVIFSPQHANPYNSWPACELARNDAWLAVAVMNKPVFEANYKVPFEYSGTGILKLRPVAPEIVKGLISMIEDGIRSRRVMGEKFDLSAGTGPGEQGIANYHRYLAQHSHPRRSMRHEMAATAKGNLTALPEWTRVEPVFERV